jgi:chemotaxis receptor (MCP) glutamine deamidase CheD
MNAAELTISDFNNDYAPALDMMLTSQEKMKIALYIQMSIKTVTNYLSKQGSNISVMRSIVICGANLLSERNINIKDIIDANNKVAN